jgi:multimeric flavodoxin WrbA
MKILVANGSPRGAHGNTEVLVQQFVAGAREGGAEVETVYLKDKQINHCVGCFNCWFKTPGSCIHKDDMPELLKKMQQADLLVYAMPLYVYTVPGIMKDFMDRIIPIVEPYIETRNGISTHPARNPQSKFRKIAIISSCGFPEMSHFNGLKETFKTFMHGKPELIAASICCCAGAVLKIPQLQPAIQWYLDAVKQAGKEVVESGHVSEQIQAVVDRPLIDDPQMYINMANENFDRLLSNLEGATVIKDTRNVNGTLLQPSGTLVSVKDHVAALARDYDAQAHPNFNTVVQLVITDEEPGSYYLRISDGRCDAYIGEHDAPTTTVSTTSNVWLAIVRGELDGTMAFMNGQFKVAGDMAALLQLGDLLKK